MHWPASAARRKWSSATVGSPASAVAPASSRYTDGPAGQRLGKIECANVYCSRNRFVFPDRYRVKRTNTQFLNQEITCAESVTWHREAAELENILTASVFFLLSQEFCSHTYYRTVVGVCDSQWRQTFTPAPPTSSRDRRPHRARESGPTRLRSRPPRQSPAYPGRGRCRRSFAAGTGCPRARPTP